MIMITIIIIMVVRIMVIAAAQKVPGARHRTGTRARNAYALERTPVRAPKRGERCRGIPGPEGSDPGKGARGNHYALLCFACYFPRIRHFFALGSTIGPGQNGDSLNKR